jgi:hypothetical protein
MGGVNAGMRGNGGQVAMSAGIALALRAWRWQAGRLRHCFETLAQTGLRSMIASRERGDGRRASKAAKGNSYTIKFTQI